MIRAFRAAALIGLAIASTISAPAHADAVLKAKTLVSLETKALARARNGHLEKLVTPVAGAQGAGGITYSNDWLARQPIISTGGAEWQCLSEALYFEARGESVQGLFAVAEVIMNRVRSKSFPSTPCAVVNQGTGRLFQCQFTFRCDGHKEVIREPRAYERVAKVARAVLDGANVGLTDGATHYHTTSVRPRWSRVFHKTARIGVHIFYRPNIRTASN